MMCFEKTWNSLKFVSDYSSLTQEEQKMILPILENEVQERHVRRIQHLLRRSGIKKVKRLENFDWTASPKLPRQKFLKFSNSNWIEEASNLVLIGPAGVGKTHLADGLCLEAIKQGLLTSRITCFDLVHKLKNSRNKHALIRYYSTVKIFCLDELGYIFPSQDEANDIFQIISKRSELFPTIVTTNLIPSDWGKIFEAATASAILDRLSLKGEFLTLEGSSYRSRVR